MKKELNKITAKHINELHGELVGELTASLQKAAEIGRLLSEKKAALQHGEFGRWVSDNLTFSDRTARRYIKIFENPQQLKEADSVTQAHKMLTKTDTVSEIQSKAFTDGEGMPELTDSMMELYAILEVMQVGETVTGFTHGKGKAESVTICKEGEELFMYSFCFAAVNHEGFMKTSDRFLYRNSSDPINVHLLVGYMQRRDDLLSDAVTWVHPGIRWPEKEANQKEGYQ